MNTTNSARGAPAASPKAEPSEVLRAHAEGRIQHANRGLCPDSIEGHGSRDPDCPVCQALERAAPGAQGDAEDAARYRWLRDVPMDDWTSELIDAFHLHQNAKWDALIDASRSQQEGKSHD